MLERIDVLRELDAVVDATHTKILKPDPRAYQLALDALGVPAGKCFSWTINSATWQVPSGQACRRSSSTCAMSPAILRRSRRGSGSHDSGTVMNVNLAIDGTLAAVEK